MAMQPFILSHEVPLRLSVFFSMLLLMALWELAAPRRALLTSKPRRWLRNLGLVVIDTLLLRLCFPWLAVELAVTAGQRSWGLFNLVSLPSWIPLVVSIVLLDLVIYFQHFLFHRVPVLWRLHQVHHADRDIDVSTALRFHPVEILLSMLIKFMFVLALGAPAAAVLLFEVILNGMAMFNHGNVRIPLMLDRALRIVFVTPDMHRVHHSTKLRETNSNFGFNLSWWDRLFSTYRPQPEAGHLAMHIGLSQYRDERQLTLGKLLIMPFMKSEGDSAPRRA